MLHPPHPGALLLGCLLVAVLIVGCGAKDPVARAHFDAFGTRFEITLIGVNRNRASEATQALAKEFAIMEAAWQVAEPGPLARVNMLFDAGSAPFPAPPSLLPLLHLAKTLSAQSDHLFNPALGHLVRAWGLQGGEDCRRLPQPDLVEQILAAAPTLDNVHIDGFRIWSDNPLVRLDFRDIQRGYAMDRAVARLQELGIHNASVSVDGNVHAIGSRGGIPWSLAIRGPDGGGIYATVEISGSEAAFTAGNYQNDFTWDGQVYHDILDPRTGYPAAETASVTVLHPNAATADAAATALFIAGPGDWHRLARRLGLRYVMLTDRDGRVHMNPAMQRRVKLQRDDREVIISEPLG